MKYIVTCVKRIESVVEVEADSFEDAEIKAIVEAKLGNGEIVDNDIYACSADAENGDFRIYV